MTCVYTDDNISLRRHGQVIFKSPTLMRNNVCGLEAYLRTDDVVIAEKTNKPTQTFTLPTRSNFLRA